MRRATLLFLTLVMCTGLACSESTPDGDGTSDGGNGGTDGSSSSDTDDSDGDGGGSGGGAIVDAPVADVDTTMSTDTSANLIQPSDLVYRGAFRLPDPPDGAGDAAVWEYGCQALAYFGDGDPDGEDDGYPGSLFGTGLDQYNYVSEISIPAPSTSRNLEDLNTAATLQDFQDVRGGLFDPFNEVIRVGMQYLPAQAGQASGHLYLAWGQHFHDDPTIIIPTHAWCGTDLSDPQTRGAWWIQGQSLYSVNGYLLEIPEAWAAANASGRSLGTGRYRDGGWSGMGPALIACAPWMEGDPPSAGTELGNTTLLLYSNTRGDDTTNYRLNGYQHSDEWEGGAWLTDGERSAVVFAGTKGAGYLWYGFYSPAEDGMPCVEQNLTMVGCYDPGGAECAESLQGYCEGNSPASRGWWSSRWDAQMLFYDPADLAAVAAGTMQPGEPQPYAILDLDDDLFLNATIERDMLGTGTQRRYRIGEMTCDRQRGLLYVPELFADGPKPVIHVWEIQ